MAAYDYVCESCKARSEHTFPFALSESTSVLANACEEPGCYGDLRRIPAWGGAHQVPGGARERKG